MDPDRDDDDADETAFRDNRYATVHEDPESEGPYATVTIEDPRMEPIEGPYAEIRGENPYAVPDDLRAIPAARGRDYSAPVLPPRVSPSVSDDEPSQHSYANQTEGENFCKTSKFPTWHPPLGNEFTKNCFLALSRKSNVADKVVGNLIDSRDTFR